MRSLPVGVAVGVGLAILAAAVPAGAQDEHHGAGAAETLGTVEFPTSCRPETRAGFNRAVALLHSFEFRDAIGGFETVLTADPSCAMAHWGRALAFWGNPFAPGIKGGKPLRDGRAAVEAARAAGSPTPARAGVYRGRCRALPGRGCRDAAGARAGLRGRHGTRQP